MPDTGELRERLILLRDHLRHDNIDQDSLDALAEAVNELTELRTDLDDAEEACARNAEVAHGYARAVADTEAERDRLRGAIERYRSLRRTSPEPPWVLERELFAALPNRQSGRPPTDNPDAHSPERAGDTRPDARVSKTTGSDHPSRKTCVQSVIQIDPNSSKGLDDKAPPTPETSDSGAGTSDYRTESRAPSGQSVEQGSGASEGEDRRVASGGGSPHLPGSPLAGPVPRGGTSEAPKSAEQVAQAFHDAYESLAPLYGYRTREASAKPWNQVPESNRALMIATVRVLLAEGVLRAQGSGASEGGLPVTPARDAPLAGPVPPVCPSCGSDAPDVRLEAIVNEFQAGDQLAREWGPCEDDFHFPPGTVGHDPASSPTQGGVDATANRVASEVEQARALLIEMVNTEPPRGWRAQRLKTAVRAKADISDGAATLALNRLLNTGRLDVRNGDEVFDPTQGEGP